MIVSPPCYKELSALVTLRETQSAVEGQKKEGEQETGQEGFLGPFETVSVSLPDLHTTDCLHHCLGPCPPLPSIVISFHLSVCFVSWTRFFATSTQQFFPFLPRTLMGRMGLTGESVKSQPAGAV